MKTEDCTNPMTFANALSSIVSQAGKVQDVQIGHSINKIL